jgi:hypothetical protein
MIRQSSEYTSIVIRFVVLEQITRHLIRALLALFTCATVVLAQSVFWTESVSIGMRILVVAVAITAYFRPPNGLLIVAALAPLGQIGAGVLDSPIRAGEALVLAFLAGVLIRGWTLREFRSFPSGRLEVAALSFGVIVALSSIVQLWLLQREGDVPASFVQDVLTYSTRNYFVSHNRYRMLFHAMLLLEGLALLLYAARYCHAHRAFAGRLLVALMLAATSAALFDVWRVGVELVEAGHPASDALKFVAERRWSEHIEDVNAAGSYFAMATLMAFGMAVKSRDARVWWTAGGLALAAALWMTGSRTAVVAVGLVAAFWVGLLVLARSRPVLRAVTGLVAAIATVGLLGVYYNQSSPTASTAVNIRWMFLETTWHMIEKHPAFGVGIGQYPRWSGAFSSPELRSIYPSQNAHNNFAQIAGELGLIGFAAFIAVIVTALWPVRQTTNLCVGPVLAGLAAFIISWLGGHPLLVPEVAYPFWLTLAIASGARSDMIPEPHV